MDFNAPNPFKPATKEKTDALIQALIQRQTGTHPGVKEKFTKGGRFGTPKFQKGASTVAQKE